MAGPIQKETLVTAMNGLPQLEKMDMEPYK
jgi:hypothetical protein